MADGAAGLGDQILQLYPKDGPAGVGNQRTSRVYGDGSFEFANVPPGEYVISGGRAWGNAGAAPPLLSRKEATVSNADLEGLTLTPVTMLEIPGSERLEGEGSLQEWPALQLRSPKAT